MNDERTIDGGDEWTGVGKGTILYIYEPPHGLPYSILVESVDENEAWGRRSFGHGNLVSFDRRYCYLTKEAQEEAVKGHDMERDDRWNDHTKTVKLINEVIDDRRRKLFSETVEINKIALWSWIAFNAIAAIWAIYSLTYGA